MLATPQNNCGFDLEHVQFKTVRRLNSRNWCNIGDKQMKQSLVIRVLLTAINLRNPPDGLIHHSDRGSQ